MSSNHVFSVVWGIHVPNACAWCGMGTPCPQTAGQDVPNPHAPCGMGPGISAQLSRSPLFVHVFRDVSFIVRWIISTWPSLRFSAFPCLFTILFGQLSQPAWPNSSVQPAEHRPSHFLNFPSDVLSQYVSPANPAAPFISSTGSALFWFWLARSSQRNVSLHSICVFLARCNALGGISFWWVLL